MKNIKKNLMLVVGIGVTVFFLWLALRGVDFRRMLGALQSFKPLYLIPAAAAFYYSMYLRAVRWGLLFRPHHMLSGPQMFRPIMIGFAFNSVLPGRVGEFMRAWFVGRRFATGVPTALSTVAAERIFDGAVLLGLLAGSLALLPPVDPTFVYQYGDWTLDAATMGQLTNKIILISGVLTLGVVVFMIPWTQRTIIRIVHRLPLVPTWLKQRLEQVVLQFASGFHALATPAVLARVVFQSLLLWVLIGLSNWVLALGFGLPMNPLHGMAVMSIIGIFILIPAAPGYWGLFEAGGIFALIYLGLTRDESLAMAYTLVMHSLQYFPIVAIGLFFAWQSRVKPDEALEAEPPIEAAAHNRQ